MGGLGNSKVDELTKFMPVLLTQLFRLMCSVDELAVEALVVMADVLGRVSNEAGDLLISQYQTYVFANVSGGAFKPVWEVVVVAWLALLRMGTSSSSAVNNQESVATVHRMCGFFLEIIFKSIVLQLHESCQLVESFSRKQRLQDNTKNLRHLTYALAMSAKHRARNAPLAARDIVRSVAVFVSQLLCILDRGLVSTPYSPFFTKIAFLNIKIYSNIFNVLQEYSPMTWV
jgi:dedicator of cytokinesis protein 6/7/8